MIELLPSAPDVPETRLLLRPNQAMTPFQLGVVYAALVSFSLLVALYSYGQGNVFAPVFALLEASLLGMCLALVWRQGRRCEVIAVAPDAVAVRHLPELAERFRGPPQFVRVTLAQSNGGARVWLGVHGRQVEIGAFLNQEERCTLAGQLRDMLAVARRPL